MSQESMYNVKRKKKMTGIIIKYLPEKFCVHFNIVVSCCKLNSYRSCTLATVIMKTSSC